MDFGMNYDESDLIQDGRRKRLTTEESEILLEAFARNPRPNQDERNELALKMGINSRNIQIWFQNRRAKLKKESNDPELFSTRSAKTFENNENFIPLPVVTAGNFKELCLPKYLDIPIKGQQLTTEDIYKNEAIRKFWKKQQEGTTETPVASPMKLPRKLKKPSGITTPPLINNYKRSKTLKRTPSNCSDLKFDQNLPTFDMPNFSNEPGNNRNNNKNTISRLDFTNLNFLTQSIKEINSQGVMKMNFYRPELDTVATNIDFLFDPNKNCANLEVLGNLKKPFSNQIDQTFSELFSSLAETN